MKDHTERKAEDLLHILIVHNRYQQKGGEDTVVAAEDALLRTHGHAVERLHADNEHIQGLVSQVRAATGSVYSLRGKHRVAEALQTFQPDVVHVHNFFPSLSPAVFIACRQAGVPVVHTLHNFRIQCAASTFFRDGHVCEECLDQRSPVPGIRHACYRDSRLGSAVSGLGMALHAQLGTWSHVSAYIALNRFAADKLGSFRIPRERIVIKPNFAVDRGVGTGDGDFALYVGRLSPEKGLQTLIDADAAGLLCMDVVVIGDGPMRPALEAAAARAGSRLRLQGFLQPEQILRWMKEARCLVFPSVWYENQPLVAIEALSVGLPLLVADLHTFAVDLLAAGAGLPFTPGDPVALGEVLQRFAAMDPVPMRLAARAFYERTHTPERNYEMLLAVYRSVCGNVG